MNIPPFLAEQIQASKVILFLGAGASLGAKDPKGNSPPSGKKLGEMLADKFLGGGFRDASLNQIAEFAISESDLTTVQEFIKQSFASFLPSESHKLLSSFKWAGLATTNYDRLIELAYESNPSALQIPKPFIEDGDRVEDNMRDSKAIMLLKLHGCFTRLSNPDCPLILTTDNYIAHRQGRGRIFDHLKNWAYEYPFIFIGYSLQDPDIRAIILELTAVPNIRPRYYFVAPHQDEIAVRFWETKKITMLHGSFDAFMQELNASIPAVWRALPIAASPTTHPISQKFAQHNVSLSRNCLQFLESDVDYVKTITTESVAPEDFYKGYNKEWSAIEQKLDVPRILGDSIISDIILAEQSNKPKSVEMILIKAHAGAGKTILLRRIAWDSAHDYDALCLFLKPSGSLNTAALQEIIGYCKERVYLFIDDVADRIREIQSLLKNIHQFASQLTLIAVERVNEWNVYCGAIAPHITEAFELPYLTNFEIDNFWTF